MFTKVLLYLSSSSYESSRLDSCIELLQYFVDQIPVLYTASIIRINIHQLLHLIPDDIKLWGPLWTHSGFTFESMNGILTSFIHGTQKVPKSAIYSLVSMQQLALKYVNISFQDPMAARLFEKLQTTFQKY
jgi:hypothetical protein